jgi:hypothetical protein
MEETIETFFNLYAEVFSVNLEEHKKYNIQTEWHINQISWELWMKTEWLPWFLWSKWVKIMLKWNHKTYGHFNYELNTHKLEKKLIMMKYELWIEK